MSLVAIDLSGRGMPAVRASTPIVVGDTSVGAATAFVSEETVFDALEEAEEAGYGACQGELGLPDCVYAFALRAASLENGLEPRCAVSDEYILFASDGLGDGNYTTSRGLVRAFPGWAVYRRVDEPGPRDAVYEHFPFPLLRMNVPVGNGDTTCRSADDYVF